MRLASVVFLFFGSCGGAVGAGDAMEGEKKDGTAGDLSTRHTPQCAGHRQQ